MTLQELVELKKKIEAAVLVMKKRLRPEGFNILLLEDQIHVIPRWCGDINVAFFGGLKVVPMSVEQMSDIAREIYESNS
ncbi:MAG: HIT family protein [Pyrobaculum sp.]